MARREYKGAAVKTRLSGNIGSGDTSFSIVSSAGWPAGGASGSFVVTLDPDTSTEERILVASRSGTTLNTVTRGWDDTTAVAHTAGADGTVIHSYSAVDGNEANRHINDTTIDEHTQYMRTDGTRHDLAARHTYGAALGTRPTPVAVGTGLSAGSGATAAAGDHVHILGAGSINSAAMFAAGVVDAAAIGVGAVGSSEIATDAVGSDEIAADAVGASELADASVDFANLVANRGIFYVQSTDPGAVGANRLWLNTNAAKAALLKRNAGNTAWEVLATYGPGFNYTPTLFDITLGNGRNVGRYRRHGRDIIADGMLVIGTTTIFNANIFAVGLPNSAPADVSPDADQFYFHGAARAFDGASAYGAVGIINAGAGGVGGADRIYAFATAGAAGWNNIVPFTWGTGDGFTWFAEYESTTAEDTNYV